jgi:hypothetical protein
MTVKAVPSLAALAAVLTLVMPSARPQDSKQSAPWQVLLIRHAEKPPDEAMSVDLSSVGKKRAEALPDLFKESNSRPKPFSTPDFIFATRNTKHSHRPLETVTPLARKLNLTVNTDYADDEFAKLADHVLKNPKYANKTVLICWHHGTLPQLARKLRAADAPDRIKGSVFDRIWQIDYPGQKATFSDLPQRLLPDDSTK